jgi:PhnB protein
MTTSPKAIPQGFHSITPSIVVRDAARAIEFYKKALGAKELMRMAGPDGKIMHAELQIGDSIIFLGDEMPQSPSKSPQTLGGSTGALHLYVEDVDRAFQKAIDAGGKVNMPVGDQFWGDRYGSFVDPFGQVWGLGTHKEDLSNEEMQERAKAFFAQMAQAQRKTA